MLALLAFHLCFSESVKQKEQPIKEDFEQSMKQPKGAILLLSIDQLPDRQGHRSYHLSDLFLEQLENGRTA